MGGGGGTGGVTLLKPVTTRDAEGHTQLHTRARICKRFKESQNRFLRIDSASLCSLAGTVTLFVIPVRIGRQNRFLGSLFKRLQIRALVFILLLLLLLSLRTM